MLKLIAFFNLSHDPSTQLGYEKPPTPQNRKERRLMKKQGLL